MTNKLDKVNEIFDKLMEYKEKGEEIKQLILRNGFAEQESEYKSFCHIVNDIETFCNEMDFQRYHDFRGRVNWESLVNDSDHVS